MILDWAAVEERLYTVSADVLRAFAAEHPAEEFYGFAFDGKADWAEVRLCLNTEEALRSWAAKYYPQYSAEEVEELLRWSLDDWQYQSLGVRSPEYPDPWDETWWPVQDQIQEQILEEEENPQDRPDAGPTAPRFIESLGRVLLRMEADDLFACLRRTGDFKVFLRNGLEPAGESWERLARLRRQQRADE